MNTYFCRGHRHDRGLGLVQMTLEVNGVSFTYWSKAGSCHEAAYRATEVALRSARRSNLKTVTIRGSSPLVANQMNRVWRTRNPAMKKRVAVCRSIAKDMHVLYV